MLKDLAEAIRRWTEKNVETKSFVATVVRANVRECNNPPLHLRFLRNKPVGTLHYPTPVLKHITLRVHVKSSLQKQLKHVKTTRMKRSSLFHCKGGEMPSLSRDGCVRASIKLDSFVKEKPQPFWSG